MKRFGSGTRLWRAGVVWLGALPVALAPTALAIGAAPAPGHGRVPDAEHRRVQDPGPGTEQAQAVRGADASETMDAASAALGDPARLAAIKTLRYDGVATWKGMKARGRVRETYSGLGNARVRSEFQGFGVFLYGTAGDLVWEKTPAGVTVRRAWDAAEFFRRFGRSQNVGWRELYTSATRLGSESIDGTTCIKIELVPRLFDRSDPAALEAEPARDMLYLDEKTLLMRRIDVVAAGVGGVPTTIQTVYGDWREQDGAMRAFHREVTVESGFTLVIDYEKIQHNLPIEDGFFDPDEEVRKVLDAAPVPKPKAPAAGPPRVESLREQHLAAVRVSCKRADLQQELSAALPEAFSHVQSIGAVVAGKPLVRYFAYGEEVEFEAAIPVAAPIEAKGRVKPSTLPAGEAVVVWHVGPYEKLGESHAKAMAFVEREGLVRSGAHWEEYWTDPGVEPDPRKWRTRMVFPVRSSKPDDPQKGR